MTGRNVNPDSYIYRNTELGRTLSDSLDALTESSDIDPSLADKVKAHFDRVSPRAPPSRIHSFSRTASTAR